MTSLREITDNSALVVAHPDDEILWFSSVVKNVDRIVFCFSEIKDKPASSAGRRGALYDFLYKDVLMLDMKEADVFDMADWKYPHPSLDGLEFRHTKRASSREAAYAQNYSELCERLRQVLKGYRNVITHNPWGEYGHEEHVQVYRAVKSVQAQLGFDVWVSNYCSNRSFRLMESYVSGFRSDYVTVPVDKEFAAEVRDLYKRHDCWTWYADFEWFNEESFIRDDGLVYSATGRGHLFPLNVIRMDLSSNAQVQPRRRLRLLRLVARLLRLPEPGHET
jgi:LmbE family N-acetylglucosaminyl deacetylase